MYKVPTEDDILRECKKLNGFSLYEEDYEDFISSEISEYGVFECIQSNLESGDDYYELHFYVYKIGNLYLLKSLEGEDNFFFCFKDMEDYLGVYSGYDFSDVKFVENRE